MPPTRKPLIGLVIRYRRLLAGLPEFMGVRFDQILGLEVSFHQLHGGSDQERLVEGDSSNRTVSIHHRNIFIRLSLQDTVTLRFLPIRHKFTQTTYEKVL